MKIVLAFDSFKGSLTAAQACAAAAAGLRDAAPACETLERPMADGGEGTARILMDALRGEWVPETVSGPLPDQQVEAGFAWVPSQRLAIVEMAAASGLTLVPPERRNPLLASTAGTGQLLLAARCRRPDRLWLTVGGSATVDGGMGAAQALGWRFLDVHGRRLKPGGGSLGAIRRLVPPPLEEWPPVEVLCDVVNPLCGPAGAAAVFGPQKGATPAVVRTLDAGLRNLAERLAEQCGIRVDELPGGGAAGGLAAGAVAFLGARLVRGVERVAEAVGLDEALRGADWVVTGEGSFDAQSLGGKVVAGVVRVAQRAGIRVAVIAGRVGLTADEVRAAGIQTTLALCTPGLDEREAMARAAELLRERAREFGRRAGGWTIATDNTRPAIE
jgi:glycerate kinase